MEKQADGNIGTFVHRRMSQLRILSRLLEHELSANKGQDLTIDRGLAENMLDTLEIYIDDFDIARGGKARDRGRTTTPEPKPQVTRLN
jgi:hypothetical protein